MKKILLAVILICVGVSLALAASDEGQLASQMSRLEEVVYGQARLGGLDARLGAVEKDLFGRELPGSLAERSNALANFIEQGSGDQPSLLFKLGVIEWAAASKGGDRLAPLTKRVPELEASLEGEAMSEKPLAMRVERLLSKVVSEPLAVQSATLPTDTVVRAELLQDLKPATTKKGDVIQAVLTHDVVIEPNLLVAPRGSLLQGVVTKVKKPGIFGQPSEIRFNVDKLLPLGPDPIPLAQGDASKKAAQFELSYASAAGASILGAAVLGPVGLVGGLFVRGNAKTIPAGTVFYAQTVQEQSVQAYVVPASLNSMLQTKFIDESAGNAGKSPAVKSSDAPKKPASKNADREVDSL